MKIYCSPYLMVTILLASVFMACTEQTEMPTELPINYLALGDSYTIGERVDESQRWPNQLRDQLEENGYKIEKPDIIAQNGWSTSDLLEAIPNTPAEEYNLVSLQIGVNNQFRNLSFSIFVNEFDALLEKSIAFGAKGRVFVLSIPDYGVTPFGRNNREQIGLEIDAYNAYIRRRCRAYDVPFVDVTAISRQLGDGPGSLTSDFLHPSGSQYAQWVEAVLPTVIEILAE